MIKGSFLQTHPAFWRIFSRSLVLLGGLKAPVGRGGGGGGESQVTHPQEQWEWLQKMATLQNTGPTKYLTSKTVPTVPQSSTFTKVNKEGDMCVISLKA